MSEHQGWVDWDAVAGDGISFAYIKATEGGDYVDRWFTRNWSTAAGAGLTRGAYHFFTLCTGGKRQAQNFVRALPRDPAALPPAVDLELAGNCRARPARAVVDRELRAFLFLVETTTGRRVVLYVANDFEERYGVRASFDRPSWDRRFLLRPEGNDWVVWQVGGFAHVNGVRGPVDLDVFRRTVWAG